MDGLTGFLRHILDQLHLDHVDTGDLLLLGLLFFLFREEADEAGVEYILCFKGKAGPGGLSRTEIETPVERGLFLQLEELIGKPLIHKEQRRYPLADGLTLEVNRVDAGTEHEFFYAEVEFSSEAQALAWKPGVLREYLDREVTGEKGQSMADYWAKTRGEG